MIKVSFFDFDMLEEGYSWSEYEASLREMRGFLYCYVEMSERFELDYHRDFADLLGEKGLINELINTIAVESEDKEVGDWMEINSLVSWVVTLSVYVNIAKSVDRDIDTRSIERIIKFFRDAIINYTNKLEEQINN